MTEDIPDLDKLVRLVGMQTVETNDKERIEEWTLEVYSVNDIAAKNRARAYVRRQVPNARNLLNPVHDDKSEQSTLKEWFTNSLDMQTRTIKITVVRPPL